MIWQIQSAMAGHYGESHVRQRFTDYISRFTRLASYHEFSQTGQTKIGYPTIGYRDGQLGSGTVFSDESAKSREMRSNVHRIEAWRKTKSYKLYAKVGLAHLTPSIFLRELMISIAICQGSELSGDA